MTNESLLHRLDERELAMLASISDMTELLDEDATRGGGGYRQAERRLARSLRGYQRFKHDEIFDPAIISGSPSREAAARRLKQDCIAGGEDVRAHLRRWRNADVAAEWSIFQPAMRMVTRHLHDHVTAEGVQIRLLLTEARG